MDVQLFTGVLIPGLAILISTLISVWIAASERKAARNDRAAVRTEALVDRTVSALAGLTSERFGTTSWDRHLRALVAVAYSLDTADDPRSRWLGKWIHAETFGIANPLIVRALQAVRWVPLWRLFPVMRLVPQVRVVTEWAHLTLRVVVEWSHGHIDDSLVSSRTQQILAGSVVLGRELEWQRDALSSPRIIPPPTPAAELRSR
ncbi:hypothetical protein [Microbacterium sp. 1.5R]|uniref:hypothetical protein n=1 Tax=Microbacterium sp. 1.5R TaxID=1916917 RepID=UPI0011A80424|nr:hypothetical protein [Microbacterium sp. 1.5R]